jgi:energy-coupling factor transporter ATP-binding protein EcfA2
MNLLDRINRTGTTIVMATHDVGIVDTMRRRVIELEHGHLVRDQARGVYGVNELGMSTSRGVPAVVVRPEHLAIDEDPDLAPLARVRARRGQR